MIDIGVHTEDSRLTLRCDRAVWAGPNYGEALLMASCVGSSSSVKALTALVQSGKARGLLLATASMRTVEEGYNIAKAKLGRFDAVHAVIVAKYPGLFFGDMQSGVRNYILSDAIDTPVLDAWMPHIVKELLVRDMVFQPKCYGISAWICRFESNVIDDIVSTGLRNGIIKI